LVHLPLRGNVPCPPGRRAMPSHPMFPWAQEVWTATLASRMCLML